MSKNNETVKTNNTAPQKSGLPVVMGLIGVIVVLVLLEMYYF